MVLELHVWGPAFSLPSIDPQCLAAIIYLRQILPRDDWVLIASNDDSLSPSNTLPALRDGSQWVGGFQKIVDHLNGIPDSCWGLDFKDHSSKARADITAFTTFIEAHGQPLIDLSLYVSSENYTSTTRPALSALLQWPAQWFISPQKRSTAKLRTDYLGLSSLDLDTATESHSTPTTPPPSDIIPQYLRVSRPTVTSLARQPQHAARFRLNALADAFFKPLQELLGKKRYLMSEEKPSSLDCVATAYLSLALIPKVPQRWLAETMIARYPELCTYTRRLGKESFGGPIEVGDALLGTEDQRSKELPWKKPVQKGLQDVGFALVSGTLSSLPLMEHFSRDKILLDNGRLSKSGDAAEPSVESQSLIVPSLLAVGSAVAAVGGYLVYSDRFSQPMPSKRNPFRLGDGGAAPGMGLFGDYNASLLDEKHQGRAPAGLELDVEVDGVVAT